MVKKTLRALDNTDLEILALLYKDARITNKEIAGKVNLAPSSCLERIKRLQSENIICGTAVRVDFNALGGHIQALISVRLSHHDRGTIDTFQTDLLARPEVISIFHMGGNDDFLIHVTVSDTTHLRDFVFNAVTARTEVNHVETALVYDFNASDNIPSFD